MSKYQENLTIDTTMKDIDNLKKEEKIQLWIDRYSLDLLNRAAFLVSDKQDAEDLVQEVFLAVLESYISYKKDSSIKTWLMGILKNKVADFYRKKYKTPEVTSLNHFFDETGSWKHDDILQNWEEKDNNLLDDVDFNAIFKNCINKLPVKWMIPIKLYYLEEKNANTVCEETGITTTNFWKVLQRGRMYLRECIDLNKFNEL